MSPIRMSKIESAVRVAIEFNNAFNQHDVPAMMQLLSDDCTVESFDPAPGGGRYTGKSEVAGYWNELFTKLPKAVADIEDVYGLGKRCIMRWKLSWESDDENEAHLRGVDIFRINEDLIVEILSYGKALPAAK
jgi:hypothetical protein